MAKSNRTNQIILNLCKIVFLLFFFSAFITLIIYSSRNINPNSNITKNFQIFDYGWKYVDSDGNETEISVPAILDINRGEKVIFSNTLPEGINNDDYICFYCAATQTVVIDGEIRNEFDRYGYNVPSGIAKNTIIFISLTSEDSGKDIMLIKDGVTTINGKLPEVYLGNPYGILSFLFKENIAYYLFDIVLIFLSLLTALFGIFVNIISDEKPNLFSIGLGILVVALWVLFDGKLFQFLFSIYFIDGPMSYYMTMLIPFPFIFYIESIERKRHIVFHDVLGIFSIICCTVFMTANLGFHVEFNYLLPYIDTYVAICAIALLLSIIIDGVKTKFNDYKYSAIGFAGFIFFSIVELISINTVHFVKDGTFTLAGLYIMLGFCVWQQVIDSDVVEKELRKKTEDLDKMTLGTIITIANTVDAKDKYTGGHSLCVAEVSKDIGKRMGWDDEQCQKIYNVGLLHDIGKIAVPDYVLNRPGRLTDEEFAIIKRHPVTGAKILKDIAILDNVQEGALYHHERWDGRGYPKGLSGEDIPIFARVIAIADSYDAMSRNRIYRKHLEKEQIINEFIKNSGSQFDPSIAAVFVGMLNEGYSKENLSLKNTAAIDSSDENSLLNLVVNKVTQNFKEKSDTDSLTGLYNRTFFADTVREKLLDDPNGAFIMIDIDNFKSINDTNGHLIGDNVIRNFSELLKSSFRENDIICRMGGDEFGIFIPGKISKERLSILAEGILDGAKRIVPECGLSANDSLSVSIGIAIAPKDGNEYLLLYNAADKALYHVKENGKNKYHYFGSVPETEYKGSTEIDMQQIKGIIEGTIDLDSGALSVKYNEFKNIYNYIFRYVKRNNTNVQVLLFTLSSTKGDYPDVAIINTAMNSLDQAVIESLRKVDVGTRYSSNQYIVILTDSDSENGKIVGDRVVEHFYRICREMDVLIKYDIESIVESNDK